MNVYFTSEMTSSEVSISNIQKSVSFSSSTQINTVPPLDVGPKRKQAIVRVKLSQKCLVKFNRLYK